METEKDDLDTNSDHSDSTLSIPSGSDSNRSESPETVVGNSKINEDIMKNDHQINFKHPGSQSNALVKQQKVTDLAKQHNQIFTIQIPLSGVTDGVGQYEAGRDGRGDTTEGRGVRGVGRERGRCLQGPRSVESETQA